MLNICPTIITGSFLKIAYVSKPKPPNILKYQKIIGIELTPFFSE